jgi:hypothetical protein
MISSWLQEPATFAGSDFCAIARMHDRGWMKKATFLASRCWEKREKNDFGNGRHGPLIYRTRYCGDTSF